MEWFEQGHIPQLQGSRAGSATQERPAQKLEGLRTAHPYQTLYLLDARTCELHTQHMYVYVHM